MGFIYLYLKPVLTRECFGDGMPLFIHRLKGNVRIMGKSPSGIKIKELKFLSKDKEMKPLLEGRSLLFLNQGFKTDQEIKFRSILGRLGVSVKKVSRRIGSQTRMGERASRRGASRQRREGGLTTL
jgi:hypothetical protein